MVSTLSRGAEEAIACFQPAAVLDFLRVRNTMDVFRRCRRSEPIAQNRLVALAERCLELLVRDREPFEAHRVLPRLPVEVFGVHERPVEVPQDGAQGHF
jgi:hypothetical protein